MNDEERQPGTTAGAAENLDSRADSVKALAVAIADALRVLHVSTDSDVMLTEGEAAIKANVSQKTIARLIRDKRLDATDYGTGGKHLWRIHPDDLRKVKSLNASQGVPVLSPVGRRIKRRPSNLSIFPLVSPLARAGGKRP